MKDFDVVYLSCKFGTNILPDVGVIALSSFQHSNICDPKWRRIVIFKIIQMEKRKVRASTTLIGLSI